jgi:phospholipid N-methyltransferase
MQLVGFVDALTESRIAGWAADAADFSRQVYVDIFVNSVRIATLLAGVFREDLLRARQGDGYKAFQFDPRPYLKTGVAEVEVRHADSGEILQRGAGRLVVVSDQAPPVDGASREQLFSLSQERWKGNEEAPHLTWGRIFTGDSFIDALERQYQFSPDHHICEIGPGYGRLLKTILERKLPFRKYSALELSADRAASLAQTFPANNIQFLNADAITARLPERADLVICSATFEHLFPDFTAALTNLVANNLNPGGRLAIDYVQKDPAMDTRSQGFERSKAFVRIYPAKELRQLYKKCGLPDVRLESIVLGEAAFGAVSRIFVFAKTDKS